MALYSHFASVDHSLPRPLGNNKVTLFWIDPVVCLEPHFKRLVRWHGYKGAQTRSVRGETSQRFTEKPEFVTRRIMKFLSVDDTSYSNESLAKAALTKNNSDFFGSGATKRLLNVDNSLAAQ